MNFCALETLDPPKEPGAIVPIVWEFDDPATTVTEMSATASVVEGQDPNPTNILGPIVFANNKAILKTQNGVHGATYKIKATITLSDGTRLVETVLLPVIKK